MVLCKMAHKVELAKRWMAASLRDDAVPHPKSGDCTELLYTYSKFVCEHRHVVYHAELLEVEGRAQGKFKWVGAVESEGRCIFAPNDAGDIAVWTGNGSGFDFLSTGLASGDRLFRWSGVGLFEGTAYCFPRSSNEILSYNVGGKGVRLLPLGTAYEGEHHYGGVISSAGIIYQPPRDEDHILTYDIKSGVVGEIRLVPRWLHAKLRYSGSVLHPNGLIYFLPERDDKVVVLDPASGEVWRIGDTISPMVFGAAIAPNGHIYGFPSDATGILHIDPDAEVVEMIHLEIGHMGCYASKPGIDGWLYGIPGDGDRMLRFDPIEDRVEEVDLSIEAGIRAKWAGGTVLRSGDIVCPPSGGNNLLHLIPSEKVNIPTPLFESVFSDCY